MEERRPSGDGGAGSARERKAAELIQEAVALLNQARLLLLVPGSPERESKTGEIRPARRGSAFPTAWRSLPACSRGFFRRKRAKI